MVNSRKRVARSMAMGRLSPLSSAPTTTEANKSPVPVPYRNIFVPDPPKASGVPVITDVVHSVICQLCPGDNHLLWSQLRQAEQLGLILLGREGQHHRVFPEQQCHFGGIGGNQIRPVHQFPHPPAHFTGIGFVNAAVIPHHRIHHRHGVGIGIQYLQAVVELLLTGKKPGINAFKLNTLAAVLFPPLWGYSRSSLP